MKNELLKVICALLIVVFSFITADLTGTSSLTTDNKFEGKLEVTDIADPDITDVLYVFCENGELREKARDFKAKGIYFFSRKTCQLNF